MARPGRPPLERVDGIGYRDCVRNKQAADRRLIAFGYGDGGGGPQFEMIEAARRLTDLEGCPKVSYDSVSGFMQKLEARGGNLPDMTANCILSCTAAR